MGATWTPAQRALVGDAGFMLSAATLFPNLSFVHNWPEVDDGRRVVPFISIRLWQPVSADETEVLSWFAVDRNAPEWFKADSYKAYLMCFGSSGMFEQDDVENWVSITQMARGTMARRLNLNSRMGLTRDGDTVHGADRRGRRRGARSSATASTTSASCCRCGATTSRPAPPTATVAWPPSTRPDAMLELDTGRRTAASSTTTYSTSSIGRPSCSTTGCIANGSGCSTDDVRYRDARPRHESAQRSTDSALEDMAHFDEDRYSLEKRVERFETDHAWTEDPPSRTRRFVTNVRCWHGAAEDELVVASNLLLFRSRGDIHDPDLLSARRHDVLRRDRRRAAAGPARDPASTSPCCARRTWRCSCERSG